MTRADIITRLERHKAAFANRDAERLANDHAIDGTFESPAHGLVRGRPMILKIYHYWFTAFPDLDLTWDSFLVDGDEAAFFWTLNGTTQGEFFGVARAGTRVHLIGAANYRFSDEGIVVARHVFDFSGMLIKAGVLKARAAE
jgi:predicted ester cyclase